MRYFLVLLATLLASGVSAQDAPVIVGEVLYEDDPNRTLISKPGWLRGLHLLGEELDPEERPLITAPVPVSRQAQTLCARITSISGNYEALVQFVVPGTPPGARVPPAQRMTFTSQFPDTVKQITSTDSGVTVQRGTCVGDTQEDRRYFATFWNNSAETLRNGLGADAELVLNMNVARADEIEATALLSPSDGGSSATALPRPTCEKIDQLEALAFNYRCAVGVPIEVFQRDQNVLIEFSFEALYRGRTSPRRRAEIEIGAVR